jgi:uncharacterized membrane protein
MLIKYLAVFLVSMVPLIELRGAVPIALGWGLDPVATYVICILGNMLPVPIIYFFARKVLLWGKDKRFIGKFFTFCLRKGERAGQKLASIAGRHGLFVAMLIFVGIPLPGTGAWTGSLVAAVLDMRLSRAVPAITAGVLTAGAIITLLTHSVTGL